MVGSELTDAALRAVAIGLPRASLNILAAQLRLKGKDEERRLGRTTDAMREAVLLVVEDRTTG